MASHEDYMAYCIKLARLAGKKTRTNPMVGSILVYNNKVIGEGFHKEYGENHAERNAIKQALENHAELIPKSTLYVTLEPCDHQGKTPPCVDYILTNNIKKVVIGCSDPNPDVASKSVNLLKENNVEVVENILEAECSYLISKFRANLKKRPYIILKWAQSLDGYIGQKDKQVWISNEYSKILVHKWRSEIDGIMVGTQTAIQDDPALTTRDWKGENPTRIVPDNNNRLPKSLKILNDGKETLVLNMDKELSLDSLQFVKIESGDIKDYWSALYSKGICSVMVEGGRRLLNEIISAGLWDEARVITSQKKLYEGIRAPIVRGKLHTKQSLSGDQILTILNVPS